MEIKSTTGEVAIISRIDRDLSKFRWSFDGKYFYRHQDRTTIFLHRIILSRKEKRELKTHEFTDHKDRNKLNNKRSNIRLASNSQNQANQKLRKDNKSGYRGVTKIVVRGKYTYWRAHIRHNGVKENLGHFKVFEEAKKIRDAAAIKYFGNFASID